MTRQTTAERVQIRKERNQSIVRAKVAENFQAGIGVASTWLGGATIYNIAIYGELAIPSAAVVAIAVSLGVLWFGLLSVVRFSLDEVRDGWQWFKLHETAAKYYQLYEQEKASSLELRRELRKCQSQIKTQDFNQVTKTPEKWSRPSINTTGCARTLTIS